MPSELLPLAAVLALSLASLGGPRMVVHESSAGGVTELWRSGGTGAGRILTAGIAAFDPAVAADGTLAFMRPDAEGNQSLWVALRGTRLRKLSPGGVDDRMPALTADGRRLAFVRHLTAGRSEIRVMERDALRSVAIRTAAPGVQHLAPAWHPDGQRLAFASNADGRFRIWLMAADGSRAIPLTDGATDLEPAWSPDGRRLVFVRQFPDGGSDLVIRDLGAGTDRRLVLDGNERRPSWGPFSDRIAFASDADGDMEIYYVHPDGGDVRRLTDNAVADLAPAWLPPRQP